MPLGRQRSGLRYTAISSQLTADEVAYLGEVVTAGGVARHDVQPQMRKSSRTLR